MHICISKGLDPLSNEVHCIERGSEKYGGKKISIEVSVHGLLKLCASQLAGSETVWFDSNGNPSPVWLSKAKPAACQVKLWRRGCTQPFIASALMADYDTTRSLWKTIPSRMIEKVATAQCLRLGFADLAGGLYSPEEMPEAPVSPSSNTTTVPVPNPEPVANPVEAAKPVTDPLEDRKVQCREALVAFYKSDQDVLGHWTAAFKEAFPTAKGVEKLTVDWLHTEDQVTWCEQYVETYKSNAKTTAKK